MRALFALCLILLAAPAAAQERILRFASEIEVAADASLKVSEDITVRAEGQRINHGIFRDFPTTYTDRLGRRVRVGFDVLAVERDGKPEPYSLEALRNGKRIRIGSADVTIPKGEHRYRITYRTTRQLGFFDDFDELYWNVTGTDWAFPINQISATVHLPDSAPILRSALYTGPQGARGHDARVVEQRPGLFVVQTTRPLDDHEGLTLAVAWPKGFVDPPGRERQMAWFVADNASLLVAGVGIILILLYYLVAWLRVGRDPAGGTIIPLFTPPEGLSAPAARFAAHMGFDDRAFAAGILSLAVKGRLRISDAGKAYQLDRQEAPATPDLTTAEAALDRALFAESGSLELKQTNHKRIRGARDALKKALTNELDGPVFRTNTRWFGVGLALSALLLIATLFLLRDEVGDDQIMGLGFFAIAVPAGLTALLLHGLRRWWEDRTWGNLFHALIRVLLFATVTGFGLLLILWTGAWPVLEIGVPALVLVALGFVFFHLLKAPTPSGRSLLDRIEGFKRYLTVAEEHRLGILNPPERTPELFERYLPYALALGVEHAWSQKFASVLARSAAEGQAQPSWYSGDHWNPSRPSSFADRVGSSLASAAASAGTAPGSSSGSGGGGSSGGGGGGGGGGGW